VADLARISGAKNIGGIWGAGGATGIELSADSADLTKCRSMLETPCLQRAMPGAERAADRSTHPTTGAGRKARRAAGRRVEEIAIPRPEPHAARRRMPEAAVFGTPSTRTGVLVVLDGLWTFRPIVPQGGLRRATEGLAHCLSAGRYMPQEGRPEALR